MSSFKDRRKLFDRQIWLQRGRCYFCDKVMKPPQPGDGRITPDQATRDHLVAQSKGGKYIVACCTRCNNLKGDNEAKRFKRIVKRLLENPEINAIWHQDVKGIQPILFRIIQIERWKEKQAKKPNEHRQQRIEREIALVVRLIRKLKP